MTTFRLPDLGEGLEDAELVSWHVNVGDRVVADQPLLSVETAKAVVEVPSPCSGRVARLVGAPGDFIKVGATLAEIESELAFLEAAAKHRDKREFIIAAIYAERLRTAVISLKGICTGLELKASGGEGPSWAEYNAMLDAYQEAKSSYSALGPDLNRFHRDAPLLDELDRRNGQE